MTKAKTLADLLPKDAMISPLYAWTFWKVGDNYVNQEALDRPPVAPSDRIFFPLAVARAGRSTDPDWGDWERKTLHFPKPVPEPVLKLDTLVKQDEAKAPQKPQFPVGVGRHPGVSPQERQKRTELYERRSAAWYAAAPERIATRQQILADEAESYRKWNEGATIHGEGVAALDRAFETLVVAALDHKVDLYFRHVDGGEMRQLEPSILTRKGIGASLIRNGTYLATDGKTYYLFADADQMKSAFPLRAMPDLDIGGRTLDQLSPYLQLAIHIALKNKVDPNYRAKKRILLDDIEAEMQAFGLDNDQLSPSAREYLATFIRWPDARKGRAETE